MTDWFYYDEEARKQGPYSGGQLRGLVRQGIIEPKTVIETAEGERFLAEEVKGLMPAQPSASPSSPEANPFTAPLPTETNPFTAPMPSETNPFTLPTASPPTVPTAQPSPTDDASQGSTLNHYAPVIKKSAKIIAKFTKILVILLLVALIPAIAWPIFSESRKLHSASREYIAEALEETPLEIVEISYDWADKPAAMDEVKSFWGNLFGSENETKSSASGKFTGKAKTTEKIYQAVYNGEGLQELGFTDRLREKEFLAAEAKIREMPVSYRNLNEFMPENISHFQFYKLLASQGDELTITGNIELIGENRRWEKDEIQLSPLFEGKFIRESQLKNAHKLDDPDTKNAVGRNVLARIEFIERVDAAYEEWKFTDVQNETLRKTVLGKLLEITDMSVDWKTRTADSASGKFTVKAKTTEKLYRPVEKRQELEKMGILKRHESEMEKLGTKEIFEKELYEGNLFKRFNFYELSISNGTEVTLTGEIKLSKSALGVWQSSVCQLDTISPVLEGFTLDSQLLDGLRLDDPETKALVDKTADEFIRWLTALVQQKDDFDKYCKGKTYKGSLKTQGTKGVVSSEVHVVFEQPTNPKANTGRGTIEIIPPGIRKKGKGERSFVVRVNTEERVPYSVTGTINNAALPGWGNFYTSIGGEELTRAEEDSARRFYGVLHNNVNIEIAFSNMEMVFTLTDRDGENRTMITLAEVPTKDSAVEDSTSKLDRTWVQAVIQKRPPALAKPVE